MIYFQHRIHRRDLTRNCNMFYVFGDNDLRAGYGGQAREMRGEPNAIGIRTKRAPYNIPRSFYLDEDFHENSHKIRADFAIVKEAMSRGHDVMFPADGIGTGRAQLSSKYLMFIADCMREIQI